MALAKLTPPPGINSQQTQVKRSGGWFAGNLIRWRFGELEKMGGWLRLLSDTFLSYIRCMHAWQDLDNHKNLLVGSDLGLQLVVNDAKYTLGPEISVPGGTFAGIGDPDGVATFSSTIGSAVVTVLTTQAVNVGDTFTLLLPISIGGRILAVGGLYTVTGVTPGVSFTFNMASNATTAETGVYGTRVFVNTVADKMTCTWKAHGLIVGNTITFNQATSDIISAFGKRYFTIAAGETVTIDTVPTADTFTFFVGTHGSGMTGGGGNAATVYDGWQISQLDTSTYTTGKVLGFTSSVAIGNPQKNSWYLDNLGETGLALITGGQLLAYTPPVEAGLFILPVDPGGTTAPQISNGMLVAMPQAQVIVWGTEPVMGAGATDPLLLRFSDAGTFDTWTATVSNQAGSFRLGRGSKIVGALQAPQTTLILTDTDVWMMSYIGPPLIYGFTIIGAGCGLLAPHAIVTLGRATFWLSEKGVWQFGDTGVQPVACLVWDFIFNDLDRLNINKCHAGANSSANEVMFWFPAESEAVAAPSNLLYWSQDFAKTTTWMARGATIADSGPTAPDGTATADVLTETAVTDLHQVLQSVYKLGERTTYTLSVYARNDSTGQFGLRASTTVGSVFAIFDAVAGTVVDSGASLPFVLISTSVSTDSLATGPAGNGWRRFVMAFTSDDAPDIDVSINRASGGTFTYLGAGGLVRFWGAMLNVGSSVLPYVIATGTQVQNETSFYIKYNPLEKVWDSGMLLRTAWIDNSVFGTPLGADSNYRIQQHEVGYDDDDQPMRGVYAETGYAMIGDGTHMMRIDQCQPDFKWFGVNGAVDITIKGLNYAGGIEEKVVEYGPYSITQTTQFFAPRVRARYVAIRYDWAEIKGFSARVGATTFRLKPAGSRP